MSLGLSSGAFPVPGGLVLSVLEKGHKVSKQIALHEECLLPFSSWSSNLRSPKHEGQASFFPPSPPALSISFLFALHWLIVASSTRWELVSPWHVGQELAKEEGAGLTAVEPGIRFPRRVQRR